MNHDSTIVLCAVADAAPPGPVRKSGRASCSPTSRSSRRGALLSVVGVAGVLVRRNISSSSVGRLILNAANLNFIAFAAPCRAGNMNAVAGQVFTVFIIVVAAAEAAIGLGIVIALYRNRETIFLDKIDLLKW